MLEQTLLEKNPASMRSSKTAKKRVASPHPFDADDEMDFAPPLAKKAFSSGLSYTTDLSPVRVAGTRKPSRSSSRRRAIPTQFKRTGHRSLRDEFLQRTHTATAKGITSVVGELDESMAAELDTPTGSGSDGTDEARNAAVRPDNTEDKDSTVAGNDDGSIEIDYSLEDDLMRPERPEPRFGEADLHAEEDLIPMDISLDLDDDLLQQMIELCLFWWDIFLVKFNCGLTFP